MSADNVSVFLEFGSATEVHVEAEAERTGQVKGQAENAMTESCDGRN